MTTLPRLTPRRLWSAILIATVGAALVLSVCPLLIVDLQTGALGWLSLSEILSSLGGPESTASRIYFLARLPPALAGFFVGGGLAIAGCAFQALLRNPLADPYTLGVSSGSSLAAVVALRLGAGGATGAGLGVGVFALAGAAVTVVIVWRLGRVGATLPPATLLLGGITIAMFCSAATMFLIYTAGFREVSQIVRWLMGGLDWIDYPALWRSAVCVAVASGWILTRARDLNAMSAGHDAALAVGVHADRTLRTIFVAASVIVGATIAIAGPIGFVGLLVPHVLRTRLGPDHRQLLPLSFLVGGAALVVFDTLARLLWFPAQLPVGVVTAMLGGPFFLYLILREKHRGTLWGG